MKLIWSLSNKNPQTPHNGYIYDMFYLSIQLAKDLNYKTVLYGTTDAIVRLGEYVDEVINTDNLDYVFFDDCKIHIWETRDDDYATIDGDVFLFNPINLSLNKNSYVWFDEYYKPDNNKLLKNSLELLKTQNIFDSIPEWDFDSINSVTTNIVRWKGNDGLLKYYINTYKELRKRFLEKEAHIKKINSELTSNKSLISHIICEQLLDRLITYYNIPYTQLRIKNKKNYSHWQGPEKFENKYKINSLKLIVEIHKLVGGNVKSLYNSLISQKLIEPILFN